MMEHSSGRKINDKHRSYIDLWDAFQERKCPICILVEQRYHRDIDGMIKESSLGSKKDEMFQTHAALCHGHVWAVWASVSSATRGSMMGAALRVQEEDLKKIIPMYEGSPTALAVLHKLHWRQSPADHLLKRMKSCLICQKTALIEKNYLKALLINIMESDFAAEFKKSAGLCFPHIVKALASFPYHRNSLLLIKAMIDRIHIRRMELSEAEHPFVGQDTENARIDFQHNILEMISGRRESYSGQIEAEKNWIGEMDNHPSPSFTADESGENDDSDSLQPENEKLKFEIEKLKRQNEKLRSDCMRERAHVASLNYRYWECSEENKRLQMNLTGARAKVNAYKEHVGRLNEEIRILKEALTNRETTNI